MRPQPHVLQLCFSLSLMLCRSLALPPLWQPSALTGFAWHCLNQEHLTSVARDVLFLFVALCINA